MKNDFTDEFILGFDREIGLGFAVGVNYVWRKYGDFQWNDRDGIATADWVPSTFTPAASACPGARQPHQRGELPDGHVLPADIPAADDHHAGHRRGRSTACYNGLEMTGAQAAVEPLADEHQLRLQQHDRELQRVHRQPAERRRLATLIEDPTNRDTRDGFQYDYPTAGSGIGNIYVNAKWLFKVSGMYQLPGGVNVSAFFNARQGYPFERFIQAPSRDQRRRADRHPARSGRREPAAELPEPRLPRRASGQGRDRPVHPVAGRLQRRRTTTRFRRSAARRTRRTPTRSRRSWRRASLRFGVRVQLVRPSVASLALRRGRGRWPRPLFLRYPVERSDCLAARPELHARRAQSRPGSRRRRADDRARRVPEARRRPVPRPARRARRRRPGGAWPMRRCAGAMRRRGVDPMRYARVMALNEYLFGELRFVGQRVALRGPAQQLPERGARPAHRHSDHAGAALHGSRAAGRAADVEGINFPGHFLLRCPARREAAERGRPDHRRLPRRRAAVRARPAAALAGTGDDDVGDARRGCCAHATKPQILARMLLNLKRVYVQMHSYPAGARRHRAAAGGRTRRRSTSCATAACSPTS